MKQVGIPFLDALNNGHLPNTPGFASGGPVVFNRTIPNLPTPTYQVPSVRPTHETPSYDYGRLGSRGNEQINVTVGGDLRGDTYRLQAARAERKAKNTS